MAWDDSTLKEMFETTKFMFAVFKEYDGDFHFDSIKFWNMPVSILENDVKSVWEKTVNVIKNGDIVNEIKNGKWENNFPKITENDYCHVRPHAKDSTDVYPLPVQDKVTGLNEYTKQCFWLNSGYILNIINSYYYLQ